MFEQAERIIAQELKNLLNITIWVGIPDPEIISKATPPYGIIYLASCKPIELISDGVPDKEIDNGDGTMTVTWFLGEGEMEFQFELVSNQKRELDNLTLTILKHFSNVSYLGDENEYVVGIPSFRDELPGEREERVFVRIFTIPLTGPLTMDETLYKVVELDQDNSFVTFDPL